MEHDLFDDGDAPLVADPRPAKHVRGGHDPDESRRRKGPGRPGGLILKAAAFVFGVGVLGVVAVGAFAALYLNRLNAGLPDYEILAQYEPPVTTRVYAGDGSLVAEFARERRIFVPIEAMPTLLKEAFISAEDKKFYEHDGVDMRGVLRAQVANVGNLINGRRLEGGSTITQQVAKNFLLTSEQKIERKLREWLIARRIEKAYTKDKILELYLNEIYLGNRSYGVAAAALNYFDKSLDQLTLEEAAYLAAIPKGPSNYHPVRFKERATERRNWVIGRMVEDGKVEASVGAEARAKPLEAKIAPPLGARDWAAEYFAEEVRKQVADRYGASALYDGGLAIRTTLEPRLQEEAGRTLRKWLVDYDRRHGWRGAIDKINLAGDDEAAIAAAFEAIADHPKIVDDLAPWRPAIVLEANDARAIIALAPDARGVVPLSEMAWARPFVSPDQRGPELSKASAVLSRGDLVFVSPVRDAPRAAAIGGEGGADAVEDPFADDADAPQKSVDGMPLFALEQIPAVNGALVALDPHTGRVLAMVGGFSFQLSEFNRAVQAKRQPGSTFKPFVYAAALDAGYTPSSIVLDAPFVAPSLDSWWKPGNYVAGRFYGESTLRLGIEQSRNTMTARLAQEIGIGRVIDYANRFNLAEDLPRELAISLGSGETTLMRITAGYSTFVNGGKTVIPFVVDRVQDRHGKTILREDTRACDGCSAEFWQQQEEPSLVDPRQQAIDPRTAYQMVSMLEGVVQRGTGSRVRKVVDKPVAGKTGTTNEYKDAWFVGFAPDLAVGVFIGFDLPTTLGQGEAGGVVAAPVFGDFMATALADTPGLPFRVPSGIRLVRVNAKTGRPAGPGEGNVILEAFKAEDSLESRRVYDETLDFDPLADAPSFEEDLPTNGENLDDLSGLE